MPSLQFAAALVALFATLTVEAAQQNQAVHGAVLRRHSGGHLQQAARARRSGNPMAKRQPQRLTRRADSIVDQEPDNLADGTATADEGCTQWVLPTSGDSCYSVIALSEGLTLSDFLDLNTSLDQDCQNLSTQSFYCIDTGDSHDSKTTNNAIATDSDSCNSKPKSSTKKNTNNDKPASTPPSVGSTSKSDSGSTILGLASTIRLSTAVDPACGKNGATSQSSNQGGPNGALSFLNCGLNRKDPSSLWTPPKVTMDQVVYSKLDKNGIFSVCSPYFGLFEKYGAKFNLPPIFLASFALLESSCNPNASGDSGGAYGLMQITEDKCGNAPGGNCNDPDYNVMTGAAYFASVLEQTGGDVLKSLGQYNGWTTSMSIASATAAANSGCCECQNNLDYMNLFLNGYALNRQLTTYYDNLAVCHS